MQMLGGGMILCGCLGLGMRLECESLRILFAKY